ncbi:hypothetical protein HMPREF9080_00040 [Cardiobacterium valvarum F0432]|uniref:Uncharacterized protein n=1 Tax=Cardiobacterium valvarum F0432 TaxID=797473 RepID=G9ZBB7_9GAMM|nr:hypothetical protein HMPREF9080_00040 [Cardiobacterium valvarum F0432]
MAGPVLTPLGDTTVHAALASGEYWLRTKRRRIKKPRLRGFSDEAVIWATYRDGATYLAC